MHLFYKSKIWAALCFFAVFALVSCDKDEDPVPATTLQTLIDSNSDLSLFKAAISRAKLTSFTEGPGPFTILAPNNAAFNAIGISSEAQINALDSNTLVNLLTYHLLVGVSGGTRSTIELPAGPNGPVSTQSGGTVYVTKNAGGVFLNGVKIVVPDQRASNGYLHIVNRVLYPPILGNALSVLTSNPDYKLFVQAINKAAVTANFTAAGPLTIFAPNNAAFVAAGLDSTAIANSTATILSPIVRYHIYLGRLFSGDFKSGALKMQTNAFTTLNASPATIKGITNPAPFAITTTDITTSNGVIHAINGVLKP